MFKKCLTLTAGAAIGLQVLATPAHALNDREKTALAAAALLGIAALSHHNHHDRDASQSNDAQYKAMFERGYRDGLYNDAYDSRHSSTAYSRGYDAGQKERANRLAYKQHSNATRVPAAAMRSCVNEAASSWGIREHDVHVIKAGQEGSDNYYIELAAGHKHVICGTNSKGQVFNLRDGRL